MFVVSDLKKMSKPRKKSAPNSTKKKRFRYVL